jgi:hypothetical protein
MRRNGFAQGDLLNGFLPLAAGGGGVEWSDDSDVEKPDKEG